MADDENTDAPAARSRYFTPSEANTLLPGLRAKMKGIADRIDRARSLTESVRGTAEGSDARGRAMDDLDTIREEIEALVQEINAEGVEVKGLSPGLLDFPALFNGREVYLCWKEGEDRIEWWHPIHTGIAGRQKVEPAHLGGWEWVN